MTADLPITGDFSGNSVKMIAAERRRVILLLLLKKVLLLKNKY